MSLVRKNETVRRGVGLLLAFLLLLPLFVSCSSVSPEAEPAQSAPPTDDAELPPEIAEEPAETTITDTIREQYKDIDYAGQSFRLAGYGPGEFFYFVVGTEMNEIWYESMTGDLYTDAVYQRNSVTEDLLNIRIEPEFTSAGRSYDAVSKLIEACVVSGDASVEAGYGSLAYNITSAGRGNMHNFYLIDNIDLSSPWFDQNIVKNYSLHGNKLYALTGAYGIYDDYSVPVIYYNKDILSRNSMDDPAELVMEGKWTFDTMKAMMEVACTDLDGDGKITEEDIYGYLDNADILPHLMEATGNLQTKIDSEGVPYVNCLTGEYIEVAETVYNTFITNPTVYYAGSVTTLFRDGHALFAYELLATINSLRDMETLFSLLPLPKLNEQQEKYVNPVNSVWCTAFCVPVTITGEDLGRVGMIINVLSALSEDTVTTVLYDQILGVKLIREENTLVMLDYSINNKQYCWANGYYEWNGPIASYLGSYAAKGSFDLASTAQKFSKTIQKAIDRFLEQFEQLP
ncbi:MAG: hypothetical protein E7576_02855 [Ruminococcaceae bacterium]|jgi:hypothetical protein|nr:hypothetical protein [Oscillospiraceae bacterium]